MKIKNIYILIILIFFSYSCSKEVAQVNIIVEKDLSSQVIEAYNLGLDSLESGDVLYATQKFNEAEILYPQSEWAPKAALMAAYSYYTQDYYEDTIAELNRFVKVYPLSENLDYAYYLLAICYYEQIVDEKKDLNSIDKAKTYFQFILKNYPNTEYAIDASFKIDYINDLLAAKEMYVGRYYFNKKKWIASINRFKKILEEYDTTIYVEEALHRLVEVHYTIGLKKEAQKYANLLGYNYQSSLWYQKSYALFYKNYKEVKKETLKRKQNQKNLIKKIMSILK